MSEKHTNIIWHCIGNSVIGSSHIRNGLPNQDALRISRPDHSEFSLPLILAVSDGHGSAKSFRSHIGSQKAVQAAVDIITENIVEGKFTPDGQQNPNLATIKDFACNNLPQRIVKRWQHLVGEHLENNKITEEEWECLNNRGGEKNLEFITGILNQKYQEKNPQSNYNFSIIYGATLLSVIVTDSFLVYLQIGDGDIICLDSTGYIRRPLAKDKRLIANETTSLCMNKAWEQFQVNLEAYSDSFLNKIPSLILLATDGYSNSFSSEEGFQKVAKDYRDLIHKNGINYIEKQLELFLSQTSAQGSGDDITIGIIKRLEEGDLDFQNIKINQNSQEVEVLKIRKNIILTKKFAFVACFLGGLSLLISMSTIFFLVYFTINQNKKNQQFVEYQTRIENLETKLNEKEK